MYPPCAATAAWWYLDVFFRRLPLLEVLGTDTDLRWFLKASFCFKMAACSALTYGLQSCENCVYYYLMLRCLPVDLPPNDLLRYPALYSESSPLLRCLIARFLFFSFWNNKALLSTSASMTGPLLLKVVFTCWRRKGDACLY